MYRFPKNITDVQLADRVIKGGETVALFGRAPFGEGYIDELQRLGICVKALFDSSYDEKKTGSVLCGLEILLAKELYDFKGIVVICGNGYLQNLINYARSCGVRDILPYYFIYNECEFDLAEYRNIYQIANVAKTHFIQQSDPERIMINSLEVAITHRCTLNCEKCANLISYFEKPKDADFHKTIWALRKILDAHVYINELRILGGEPFLNRQMVHYLKMLLEYENIGLISIMSNATIIPDDTLTEVLSNPRVYITLSSYGTLSTRLMELQALFEENNILYRIHDLAGWRDCNCIIQEELTTDELKKRFQNCSVNHCYTLYEQDLFRCPYNAGVTLLQAVPEEVTDHLNIYNLSPEDVEKELSAFMRAEYSLICGYCRGRPKSVVDVAPAKQMRGKHQYKKYQYSKGTL